MKTPARFCHLNIPDITQIMQTVDGTWRFLRVTWSDWNSSILTWSTTVNVQVTLSKYTMASPSPLLWLVDFAVKPFQLQSSLPAEECWWFLSQMSEWLEEASRLGTMLDKVRHRCGIDHDDSGENTLNYRLSPVTVPSSNSFKFSLLNAIC